MRTQTSGAIVRNSHDGERRWFAGGGVHVWMARNDETGGAYHAFVDHLVRGKMTPLHMHPHTDDSMYVVEGEILYHAAGEERVLTAGGFASALRGTPHAFMVLSDTATIFAFQTAGSSESFYLEASDPLAAGADIVTDPDLPRLQAAASNNPSAVQFLGPPPFQSRTA
jgi:quercetin dioxygenase-like cupin family protein